MTNIEFHGKDRYGDDIWTATGGNVRAIRTTREDVQAIVDTGDRSHGCAPALADWPAAYVREVQIAAGVS